MIAFCRRLGAVLSILPLLWMLATGSAAQAASPLLPGAALLASAEATTQADAPPTDEPSPPPTPVVPSRSAQVDPAAVARFNADAAEAQRILRTPARSYDYEHIHVLNNLRDRLAADRDLARTIADRSNLEARIIQAQITALGEAPAEGKSEPSAITARRKALDTQLSVVLSPVLDAREAQARASTLVSELDERIAGIERGRRSERSRSALDPRAWIAVAGDVRRGLDIAARDGSAGIAHDGAGGFALRLLAVAGLVLLGPFASIRLLRTLRRLFVSRRMATEQAARRLMLIVIEDFAAAVLLFFAIGCSVAAFAVLMRPFLGNDVLMTLSVLLVIAALMVAMAQLLAKSTLQSPFPDLRLVRLRPDVVGKAVSTVRLIGVFLALVAVLEGIEDDGYLTIGVIDLLSALLLVGGSLFVWRLATLIDKGREEDADKTAPTVPLHGHTKPDQLEFAAPFSRILKLLAIGSTSAALIGYIVLAREIFSDLVVSVAVIAVAIFLHRLVTLIVGMLAEGGLKRYRTSIHFVPMLAGIVLSLGAIPLLAVTWGYNSREIGDAIVMLRTGVSFGNVNISAGDLLTFAFVFLAGYIATKWIQRIINLTILPQFEIDRGSQASIVTMIGYVGIVASAAIAIGSTGLDLTSLAFIATALSVGLGFGLQSTVENFTSGVILLVERPIREGDWIEVGTFSGIVRKVSVRSTHLESFDRHQIIIPNSQLITGSVKNLSLGERLARVVVPVGIAYGTDLEKVRRVLLEIGKAQDGVLHWPEPSVTLDAFAESSVNMRLLVFIHDATDGVGVASSMRFEIARRFTEENIEMPFPQMEVRMHEEDPRKR